MSLRSLSSIAACMVLVAALAAGESRIPVAAEAQTSLSPKETYSEKTLIRMGYGGGNNIEIPVFRYDLAGFKGMKLAKAVMTMNIDKERAEDYPLTLKTIGTDTLIPWNPKVATLGNAGAKPGWGEGGFLKMQHGPDLAEGNLPKGADRAQVSFPFSAEGLAHLQAIIDGAKPNNGFFIDLPRLGAFPRVSFTSVHQQPTLQPYLVLTVLESAVAAPQRQVWSGDTGAAECAITADTSICSHQDEELDNLGAKDKIRIKYIQHFWAGKVDLSKAKGKVIVDGLLLVKKVEATESESMDQRKFWVSTMVADFNEGKSADYGEQPTTSKGGANHRFAGDEKQFWGRPRDAADYAVVKHAGAEGKGPATLPATANIFFDPRRAGVDDFTDVVFGNGASRYHFAYDVEKDADGWYRIPIPGDLLQSILLGEAHGLCLYDGSGTNSNYDVWSRESKFPPKLLIHVSEATGEAAVAPADLKAVAVGPHQPTLAFLEWTEGANSFGFDLLVDGKARPAVQGVAAKGAGYKHRLQVDFLEAGKREIALAAFNRSGQRAPAAKVAVDMPAPAALVRVRDPAFEAKAKSDKLATADAPVRVWACDELEMVDPQTGKLFHSGDATYQLGNPVWDGNAVTLVSAREAVACFQVVLALDPAKGPKAVPEIEFKLSDLVGKDGQKLKTGKLLRVYSAWYHETPTMKDANGQPRYLADALIPVDDPNRLPVLPSGRVPGQTNQAFLLDLYVPNYAVAGEYTGELAISSAVSDAKIPVRLRIYDVTLPEAFTFRHELNLYPGGYAGGTGIDTMTNPDAGRMANLRMHQLGRFHRLIVNTLPYSQSGRVLPTYDPGVKGIGKALEVVDWTPFDRTVEPLASGKAFSADAGYFGPLAGLPQPHIYLPLHETWPLNMAKFCAGHPAEAKELEGLDLKTAEGKAKARDLFKKLTFPRFRMNTAGPEQDLGSIFQDSQIAIAVQFAKHFAQKGWNKTRWQIYLNNKPAFDRATVFTLDEPITELDFRALGFFQDLWKRGVTESGVGDKVSFEYRADISRPQWQFDFLDRRAINLHCLSMAFFTKNYKVNTRARTNGWENWVYGGGPTAGSTTFSLYGACLNSYSLGADGILPYYTGLSKDLKTFNDLATLYQLSKAEAEAVGLKAKVQTATGKNPKTAADETFEYVGPFPSTRLLVARSAVQDIELLNHLATLLKVHRDTMRASLRNDLDFAMQVISTNPDDPGSTVFSKLTPAQIFSLRKTILERAEAAGRAAKP